MITHGHSTIDSTVAVCNQELAGVYHRDEPWVKVGSEDFDIPIGSNDGAECCELVGMYLLHSITQKSNGILHKESIRLNR